MIEKIPLIHGQRSGISAESLRISRTEICLSIISELFAYQPTSRSHVSFDHRCSSLKTTVMDFTSMIAWEHLHFQK
jgi:hypothetical protein